MKNYLANIPLEKLGIFGTITVIFTYNVLLQRDVACTCKPQEEECILYMTLPCFIIFFLILWMDKTFQRTWKYTCTCRLKVCCCCEGSKQSCNQCCKQCCCGRFCCVIIRRIIKALSVALLWVATVLIDGDWYVCCKTHKSERQKQLACKDQKTAEDQTMIAELKNYSKVIGFSMLFSIIVVATLLSSFNWRKCCEGCQSSDTESGCCDKEVKYEKLILEETETVMKEILREEAREAVTKKKKSARWKKCYDIAEELINQKPEEATAGERAGTTAGETAEATAGTTAGETAGATAGTTAGATTGAAAAATTRETAGTTEDEEDEAQPTETSRLKPSEEDTSF